MKIILQGQAYQPYFYKKNHLPSSISLARPTPSNQDKLDSLYKEAKIQELITSINILKDLETWPKNWDGYDSEKPNQKALRLAEHLLRNLFYLNHISIINWKSPNITADQDGTIVFEWWGKQDKMLIIYISPKNYSYIKARNENISEMEEGDLDKLDLKIYQDLFTWLN